MRIAQDAENKPTSVTIWHKYKLLLWIGSVVTFSVTINIVFSFLKIDAHNINILSPSHFQIVYNADPPSSDGKILSRNKPGPNFNAEYLETPDDCGSGGCNYEIKDKAGRVLSAGLSLGKPSWLDSMTDGEKDLLLYDRTYPTVTNENGQSLVRVIIECFNKKKYTYSPENCAAVPIDSKFVFIAELADLQKQLLGDNK